MAIKNVGKRNLNKDYSFMLSIDKNDIDLTVDYIKNKVSENNRFIILEIRDLDKTEYADDDYKKEIYVKLQYLPFMNEEGDKNSDNDNEEAKILELKIALMPTSKVSDLVMNAYMKTDVTQDDCAAIFKNELALNISTIYENFPIQDYQIHLKLLNLLSPNSLLFIDISGFLVRSGTWLRYTANFELPPSLDYLYAVHSIFDDDSEVHEYWFHTHGLNRLGLPEVEIMGLNDDEMAYPCSTLLTTVAKYIIENGAPKGKDPAFVEVMYETPTILKPFYEAKQYFTEQTLGYIRTDGDIDHPEDSLIVLAMKDGNVVPFNEYKDKFMDNPIFSLSNFETTLMREAARETIEYFINIFDGHKDNEDFGFLVKLGYAEQDKEEGETEHLWFDVHNFDKESMLFDATLVNKPYYDIGITEGERGSYELARLTDWIVYIEDYSYNSANIYMLFKTEE